MLHDSITNEMRKDIVDADFAKYSCDKAEVIDPLNVSIMEEDISIYRKNLNIK